MAEIREIAKVSLAKVSTIKVFVFRQTLFKCSSNFNSLSIVIPRSLTVPEFVSFVKFVKFVKFVNFGFTLNVTILII